MVVCLYAVQTRTQGFEKGGYIVKKIPIELLPGLPVESTLLEKKVYISS